MRSEARRARALARRGASWFIVFSTLLHCHPPDRPSAALEVDYAGCTTVAAGPICIPPENGRLQLWVRTLPGVPIEIRGGRVVEQEAADGGSRLTVVLAPGANALDAHAGGRHWRLALRPPPAPDWIEDLESRVMAGENEQVREVLQARTSSLGAVDRARAERLLGHIARALGELDTARQHLRAAADGFRTAGLSLDAVNTTATLAYSQIYPGFRFVEARQALADSDPPNAPAEARWTRHYLRGVLAFESGDWRRTLAELEFAVRIADRLGLGNLRQSAEQVVGLTLLRLGRGDEAAELYSRLLDQAPDDLPPCDRGQLLNNVAWSRLLAREAGEETPNPTPLLEQASALFERQPCPESDERVNVETNLALAALHAHGFEQATAHLERARSLAGAPDLRLRLWWRELEARIALRNGAAEAALDLYRTASTLAAAARVHGAQWRALIGTAAALETLDQNDEALEAYAAAEILVEEQCLQIPFDAGREQFAARHEQATRDYLELLLRLGRQARALEVARASRNRALRALRWQNQLASLTASQQGRWDAAIGDYRRERRAFEAAMADDWQLPSDRLARARETRETWQARLDRALDAAFAVVDELGVRPAAGPMPTRIETGEVQLSYHPIVDGWVGFAHDSVGLETRRIAPLDADQTAESLAASLLEPFSEQIARADVIRVQAYGFLRQMDFHALPFRGDVLLTNKVVIYDLDLPASEEPIGDDRTALLVADPSNDLAAARREARAVGEALAAAPSRWTVRLLEGDEADGVGVRAALPAATLLHVAGHGTFGGRDGWRSAMPLAGGSELTVGDILALDQAPAWVILSACETGRSSFVAPGETAAGLAQAFLAAGSRGVIASVRPIDDDLAAALVIELYPRWLAGQTMASALREAQLTLARERVEADWASFRIFEP